MKEVLQHAGPIGFLAWRAGLATLVLFVMLVVRREPLRPPPLGPTALIGVLQIALFGLLIQWALVEGGAGRTALLTYTMPFWLLVLARFTLGERMARVQWACIALAAIGLLLVIEPWRGLGGVASTAMALAAGICWALAVVVSKRLFARAGTVVTPLSLTTWQMLCGALVLVAVAAIVPERPIDWSAAFVGALAYNALLASSLAWLLWTWVVQQLPAGIAGLTSLAIPVCGVLFAWALLGEQPSLVEGVGIVLVAAALFGITRAPATR
ncbi:MAG: EamA family transporter [Xanthomonadales bacterium]|nr:EamA family transporter [Xanthomonadales bacterium]